jgi:hypothetical protein
MRRFLRLLRRIFLDPAPAPFYGTLIDARRRRADGP